MSAFFPPGCRDVFFVYQPVWDLVGAGVRDVEALVRGVDADGVEVPVPRIVAFFESPANAGVSALWSVSAAVSEIRVSGGLGVSVNVSPAAFSTAGFAAAFREAIVLGGLSCDRVIVELVERGSLCEAGISALEDLRAEGVRIALDDLQMDDASFGLADRLRVDRVKIDRALVLSAGSGADAPARLSRAVEVAMRRFGPSCSEVVFEGVEMRWQADAIAAAGGRLVQGYLFGRPQPLVSVLAGMPLLDARRQSVVAGGVVSQGLRGFLRRRFADRRFSGPT